MNCDQILKLGITVMLSSACNVTLADVVYSFTTIPNAPGATSVTAFGINDTGQIVGYLLDGIGSAHGFLYSAGSFTRIDDPNASPNPITGTQAFGINNNGQIVGIFNNSQGFVDNKGSFTTIDHAGARSTGVFGINDSGQIVGTFDLHGFLYIGGSFSTIDYPGAEATGVSGINNSGQIVGNFSTAQVLGQGFLETAGTFTTINYPGAEITSARGINNSSQIVGTYSTPGTGGIPAHGFLDSGGVFTMIDYPGAISTFPQGINDGGQIVGTYTDVNGTHSFLASPGVAVVPEPSTFGAAAGSLIGLVAMGYISGRKVRTAGAARRCMCSQPAGDNTMSSTASALAKE